LDVNGDGRVDIEDLHAIHATPTDLDGSGTADESDRAYLEAFLRAGELADMRNGR
jgi:hypothetical protein